MQKKIPCAVMRGGTSRGPFFLRSDLPADEKSVDKVLIEAIGSPHQLQVDGIGGGHPLTSKVAIVSRSALPDVDVDYLFVQVAVDKAQVDRKPNCGNMLSAVGPFAIERGLVQAQPSETVVRIRNLNSGMLVDAIVQTPEGRVTYRGEAAIDGVPGTAAPVKLSFSDSVGGVTGSLLPAGAACLPLDGTEVSLIDAAIPMMLLRAVDVGLDGHEQPAAVEAQKDALTRIEDLRRLAGTAMGLGDVSDSVLPKVGLLAPARFGGTVCVRYLTPDRCHTAIAVTGAVSVATALAVKGSVPRSMLGKEAWVPENVVIEHPSGKIELALDLQRDAETGEVRVLRTSLLRTARLILNGEIYVSG